MHRLGHQFFHQKISLVGDENRFFRNTGFLKVFFQFFQVFIRRYNMFGQKSRQILRQLLVDLAQRGIGSLRYREDPVHGFHTGFSISRLVCHSEDLC